MQAYLKASVRFPIKPYLLMDGPPRAAPLAGLPQSLSFGIRFAMVRKIRSPAIAGLERGIQAHCRFRQLRCLGDRYHFPSQELGYQRTTRNGLSKY